MFNVYGEKEVGKKEVYLRLVKTGNIVTLTACDKNGDRLYSGDLLDILSTGKINLLENVAPDLGFKLDAKGRIIITH